MSTTPETQRTCACGAPIGRQAKRGMCRKCACAQMNNDPAIIARRKQRTREYYDTPGARERSGARLAKYNRTLPPDHREMRRERGRRMYEAHLDTPEVRALVNSAEVRARGAAAQSDTKLAWCPPELRDKYRRLCASKRMHAVDARRIIEAEIPGTEEHALARLRIGAPLLAEEAAKFLQRLAPVYRCDADGQPRPRGEYWRRGTAIVSHIELVERALARGWDPDAWRTVGRATS